MRLRTRGERFSDKRPRRPILAWGYHLYEAEWRALISKLDHLVNAADVLVWNSDKKYLEDVQRNVPIVPTIFVDAFSAERLDDAVVTLGTRDLILKPRIGASAHGVRRLKSEDVGEITGAMLIQPYLTSVESEGELSLVYLGNRFSHCVRKRPSRGDFRVQSEFGGSVERVEPDKAVLKIAAGALASAPAPCAYARVDLVRVGSEWAVMELEAIEPELFLSFCDSAARAFADAVAKQLDQEL
jgi:glutathione synthase/RimK-type ligase-like ATP-grasp enzyme